MPGSETPPEGWTGWPEGKKFALVLTHDVEGPAGLEKCDKVIELERSMGFRSAFNLIPEGGYSVGSSFRANLTRNGFELGVHDLHHDGKLFATKTDFSRNAVKNAAHQQALGKIDEHASPGGAKELSSSGSEAKNFFRPFGAGIYAWPTQG